MLGVHALTEGPHWGIDLLATGVDRRRVYYVAFLLFGLTPEEKQGIMAMLGRATGRAKSPVA